MSKSYDEIMEEIRVTDEMRERILQNIATTEIDVETEPKRQTSRKKSGRKYFYRWQKYSLTAACLALLLIGAVALPKLWSSDTQEPSVTGTQGNTGEMMGSYQVGIQECSSVEALSQAAGFLVEDLQQLPFSVQETYYAYLGDGLAEIRYYGTGEERLDLRKSPGAEDNSGVYLEFDQIQETTVNDTTVTLKGDEDRIYLILWQKEDFSYSIYDEEGIPAENAEEWLQQWIG